VKPFLWKGDEIMQALNWSGELITTGEAGRRTIQMRNPGLAAGMTNTVHIFPCKLVKPGRSPGRTATPQRRSALSSKHAQCLHDRRGRTLPMFEGDFHHDANWTWHDHFNGSNEPVIGSMAWTVRLVYAFRRDDPRKFLKRSNNRSKDRITSPRSFRPRAPNLDQEFFSSAPVPLSLGRKPMRAYKRSRKAPATRTMG